MSGISTANAQNSDNSMDSVEIGLLTCAPHQEIYSLYGHTAIRYHDMRKGGIDYAFNYGMFNFHKPFFVLRFVFGLTDYELGVIPFDIFKDEYAGYGSQVTEQVLNLTNEEKMAIRDALAENYKPENRVYRYNYFRDNCTTRARDIITRCIQGKIDYNEDDTYTTSYREMIHDYNENHQWARFGNDLCLGMSADFKTDYKQQQFLPANLQADFADAVIQNTDGSTRRLVSETKTVVKPGVQIINDSLSITPTDCALIILAIILLITVIEYNKKITMWGVDALLMAICGICGIVILSLFFSQHPTTSTNLLILIFNPIPLFFIPRMIKRVRDKKTDNFFKWNIIPIAILLIASITKLQMFPIAIDILALCLLLRNISHIAWEHKIVKDNK